MHFTTEASKPYISRSLLMTAEAIFSVFRFGTANALRKVLAPIEKAQANLEAFDNEAGGGL